MKLTVPAYVAARLDGLSKSDLSISTYKGSGPGGQHRNKVETGVRIVHKATGIAAADCSSRSQAKNKREAFKKLVRKLVAYYTSQVFRESEPPTERIRTYNEQRGTVKDHRSGVVANYRAVLDGDIDLLMDVSV